MTLTTGYRFLGDIPILDGHDKVAYVRVCINRDGWMTAYLYDLNQEPILKDGQHVNHGSVSGALEAMKNTNL